MWLDDLLDFWFPLPQEKVADIPDNDCFGVVDIPLDIPEFYLRPELIPVEEPDDTPIEADRYIRIRAMLVRITGMGRDLP